MSVLADMPGNLKSILPKNAAFYRRLLNVPSSQAISVLQTNHYQYNNLLIYIYLYNKILTILLCEILYIFINLIICFLLPYLFMYCMFIQHHTSY